MDIHPDKPITADGTHWFPMRPAYGEGAFVEVAGGASFEIVYKNLAGATTPFKDLEGTVTTFIAPNFVGVDVPRSRRIGLTITGASPGSPVFAALHSTKDL